MNRPRALTSTFRFVIALLTALVVSVVAATSLPAAAVAGQGHGKGQANRPDKPDKAPKEEKAPQEEKAPKQEKAPKAEKAPTASKSHGNGNAQGHSSSGQANEPAQAKEPKSTHGQSAQAHGSRGSQGAKPASGADSGAKGDPKGNNGTVKLAGFSDGNGPGHSSGEGSTPKHPSNDPHLPCTFSVEWFGFDGSVTSAITFVQHAPTRGGNPHHDSVPLDADSHSGGGSTAGYDGVQHYNLDWEGDPHPVHGYHVKLTTSTPYSQGSDRKHKVFWVEPCEETPDEETPDEETPDEETPDEETPDEETPDDDNGAQDSADDNGESDSTVVAGAQASVQNSRGAQAAGAEAAGAEVPTSVQSGLTGDQWSWSVLPFLAVLFGLGTTFVALMRRRTTVQAVTRD